MSRTRIITLVLALSALAAALAAHAPAEAGGVCAQPPTDAHAVTVDIRSMCYQPMIVRADTGDTITWTNRDDVVHTVTSANERSGTGGWGNAEELAPGASVAHTFDRPGVYPYYCHVHLGMVGAVVVGDGNAAAFPAAAGGMLPSAPATPPQARASSSSDGLGLRDALAFAAIGAFGVMLAGGLGWRLRLRHRR